MPTINFNSNNFKSISDSNERPVININKIVFISDDKNWSRRLASASLAVKFACIVADEREGKSLLTQIAIGAQITPYHKQPVFETNLQLTYKDNLTNTDDNDCLNWRTTIELSNLVFRENESLQVSFIDSVHIVNRIIDWQNRINNLYTQIRQWIEENDELSVKNGSPTPMYEELMQNFKVPPTEVNTIDILKGKKFLLSFIPKGLWIIGANGRIDIISKAGSYYLIDTADQFQPPNWLIQSSNQKQNKISFTRMQLFNLINLLK